MGRSFILRVFLWWKGHLYTCSMHRHVYREQFGNSSAIFHKYVIFALINELRMDQLAFIQFLFAILLSLGWMWWSDDTNEAYIKLQYHDCPFLFSWRPTPAVSLCSLWVHRWCPREVLQQTLRWFRFLQQCTWCSPSLRMLQCSVHSSCMKRRRKSRKEWEWWEWERGLSGEDHLYTTNPTECQVSVKWSSRICLGFVECWVPLDGHVRFQFILFNSRRQLCTGHSTTHGEHSVETGQTFDTRLDWCSEKFVSIVLWLGYTWTELTDSNHYCSILYRVIINM